jgi:hypothetical protein
MCIRKLNVKLLHPHQRYPLALDTEYSSSDDFHTHFGGSPLFWMASRRGGGRGGRSPYHVSSDDDTPS